MTPNNHPPNADSFNPKEQEPKEQETEQKPRQAPFPPLKYSCGKGTDVAYGEGDIGEESMDITIRDKRYWTGLKSVGNLGSSEEKWDHV